MSQVLVYRQYWMATLKNRQCCQICNDFAIEAEYSEADDGRVIGVSWLSPSHRNWTAPAI